MCYGRWVEATAVQWVSSKIDRAESARGRLGEIRRMRLHEHWE